MDEAAWFKQYTWNGEANTSKVIIEPIGKHDVVARMIEPYLVSLGLTLIEQDGTPMGNRKRSFSVWVIDMSEKTYQRSSWYTYMIRDCIPLAWPSQLSIFMNDKRGNLIGRTFGI